MLWIANAGDFELVGPVDGKWKYEMITNSLYFPVTP
jgi:hypothetical protein